ncbi:hypothetical protein AB1K83_03775 [Sporosarcina sp. 179-K 3D1 HS]|uniref:hypothetical protein n=1 Tax=Sporosarcina sp. 179-K 3D1 HS TaxID=3232169 RepID=UPI0039A1FFB9
MEKNVPLLPMSRQHLLAFRIHLLALTAGLIAPRPQVVALLCTLLANRALPNKKTAPFRSRS